MRVSCVDAQDDLDDDDVDAPDDLPLEGISRSSQSSEWLHLLRSVIARRAGYLLPVLSVAATGADTCER